MGVNHTVLHTNRSRVYQLVLLMQCGQTMNGSSNRLARYLNALYELELFVPLSISSSFLSNWSAANIFSQ